MVYARNSDPTKDCNNNIFYGSWKFMNSITYFISRTIAGFSAIIATLYLFFKRSQVFTPKEDNQSWSIDSIELQEELLTQTSISETTSRDESKLQLDK